MAIDGYLEIDENFFNAGIHQIDPIPDVGQICYRILRSSKVTVLSARRENAISFRRNAKQQPGFHCPLLKNT